MFYWAFECVFQMWFAKITSEPGSCTSTKGTSLFCLAMLGVSTRNDPAPGEGSPGLLSQQIPHNSQCQLRFFYWSRGAAQKGSDPDHPKVVHQTSSSIPLLQDLLQDTTKFPLVKEKIHYKSPLEIIYFTNKKAKLGFFL